MKSDEWIEIFLVAVVSRFAAVPQMTAGGVLFVLDATVAKFETQKLLYAVFFPRTFFTISPPIDVISYNKTNRTFT